jgi:hypothetical protein
MPRSLLGHERAVDDERMAGDEGGGVGAEPEHGGGHLLRLTEATDRLGGSDPDLMPCSPHLSGIGGIGALGGIGCIGCIRSDTCLPGSASEDFNSSDGVLVTRQPFAAAVGPLVPMPPCERMEAIPTRGLIDLT